MLEKPLQKRRKRKKNKFSEFEIHNEIVKPVPEFSQVVYEHENILHLRAYLNQNTVITQQKYVFLEAVSCLIITNYYSYAAYLYL